MHREVLLGGPHGRFMVAYQHGLLRKDWSVLKDIVAILFDCMREARPGMQDWACRSFHKMCRRGAPDFLVIQVRSTPQVAPCGCLSGSPMATHAPGQGADAATDRGAAGAGGQRGHSQ